MTGPLAVSTLFYSNKNGQERRIHLILPDFSQISGQNIQALPPSTGELDQKISNPQSNEKKLTQIVKKIIFIISNLCIQVFQFIKKPLTYARERTELKLESIIKEFITISESYEEFVKRRENLEKNLMKFVRAGGLVGR